MSMLLWRSACSDHGFSTHVNTKEVIDWHHSTAKNPIAFLVGGNPSEKYESQLGFLFPRYGKIKNVPNHQPVLVIPQTHMLHIW